MLNYNVNSYNVASVQDRSNIISQYFNSAPDSISTDVNYGSFSPSTDRVENKYVRILVFLPLPYVLTDNLYFSSISNQKTLDN